MQTKKNVRGRGLAYCRENGIKLMFFKSGLRRKRSLLESDGEFSRDYMTNVVASVANLFDLAANFVFLIFINIGSHSTMRITA